MHRVRFDRTVNGASAYDPQVMLKVVLLAHSQAPLAPIWTFNPRKPTILAAADAGVDGAAA